MKTETGGQLSCDPWTEQTRHFHHQSLAPCVDLVFRARIYARGCVITHVCLSVRAANRSEQRRKPTGGKLRSMRERVGT